MALPLTQSMTMYSPVHVMMDEYLSMTSERRHQKVLPSERVCFTHAHPALSCLYQEMR